MSLNLIIAQQLDCAFETCIDWIIDRAYLFDNFYLLFFKHETHTDSKSRWHIVFRYKSGLSRSSIKNNFPGQGFTFDESLSADDYQVPINDFNEALEIKNIYGTDFKIGFVEITSINQDTTQLLLFLEDDIDKRFISPFFNDLSKFIVPIRIITNSIDPDIEEQLLESMPDLQAIELLEEEKSNNKAEKNSRFSNQSINHYEIKGKKPNDDLFIHMLNQGVPYEEIASQLSTEDKPIESKTVNNRLSILRGQLGTDIVPLRILRKK